MKSTTPHPTAGPVQRAQTLTELLRIRAARSPRQVAYTFLGDGETEAGRLSYEELDGRARAIGSSLMRMGGAGERVMLLFPPGLDYIAAFFGCLYAGAVAVPAYPPRPNRTLDRIAAIAHDAQAAFTLTTSKILSRAEPLFAAAPSLREMRWLSCEEAGGAPPGAWSRPEAQADELAYLQYTSGSTALPKGVMVTHANVLHNAAYIHQGFEHTAESVSLTWLPHFHDMGLIDGVILPLFGGFHGYLMPPAAFLQSPLRWLQAVTRYGVTHTGGPNFAYQHCLRRVGPEERDALDLRRWAVAYNGAEPVRWETMERFASFFESCGFRPEAFYPAYGLAEATLKVTGGRRADAPVRRAVKADALQLGLADEADDGECHARVLIGSGTAGSGTRVEIVRPDSCVPCAASEVGEIWVSSPSVAAGYWNRPDETELTFYARLAETGEGPFLRTGDLGFMSGGELFVTGRLKDVIIIRGLNHYPQDIERTMEESHPALRPGCGAAFPVEVAGVERLVLVQEVEARARAGWEEVVEAVRRAVGEHHEVQAHAVILIKPNTIPKTSSGKIQRHACRAKYMGGGLDVVVAWHEPAAREAGAEPSDERVEAGDAGEVADWLAARVAAKLGARPGSMDISQPIARYGLDSLAAIELIHEIETGLGVSLPMVSLLQDFTVEQLAAQISAAAEAGASDILSFDSPPEGETDGQLLSYGQRAMWFLHRLAPDSPAYSLPVAVRVPGGVDADALRRAFRSLVERHASLRTTFHAPQNGEPVQRVQEQTESDFVETDAAGWAEAALRERLAAEAHRPFDLSQGPLLRVNLYRRSADESVLLFVVHHIVADFWSMATLVRELSALYAAEKEGRRAELAPPALQYTDYARWEARSLAGGRGERLAAFWDGYLAGELPKLSLPTDRPRPPVQTFNGASKTFKLGPRLTRGLKDLGRAHRATLYTTLLAAFQVLLHRYSGQDEFLLGSPTSGRSHSKLTDVVGYFVNPVVLRADLSGDPSFEELLGRVRRNVLAVFEHQEYPFPLLVERLQPERDPSCSPLFQVMFVLQKADSRNAAGLASLALGEVGTRIELEGLALESISLEQRVAQFDLTLVMAENEDGILASLQYNTHLYDAPTITRMADHFKLLLEGLVADAQRPISRLPLLTEAEQELLAGWNETGREYERDACLHHLFERQAARSPEAVAVAAPDATLTYAELDAMAERLARRLRAKGVRPESRVGVLMRRSAGMVAALLGVLKAGGTYVPLDAAYPGERLAFMLEDSGATVLLTQRGLEDVLPDAGVRVVYMEDDTEPLTDVSDGGPKPEVVAHNLAYLIYTSGSTGRPKGVAIEHRSAVTFIQWAREVFTPEEFGGMLASTSVCFDLSVFELFGPLSWGGRVILAANVLELPHLAAAGEVTLVNTVPSAMAELLRVGGVPASVRTICLAGEPLPGQLAQGIYELPHVEKVYNLYGPSEDTTYSTFELLKKGDERQPSIGRPIANTRLYILTEELLPVPLGVAGEVYLGGDGLARGYLGRPSLTAERFVPDPFSAEPGRRLYRTGDRARFLADGRVEFLGRLDHQVKIRGYRIEPGEVEAALERHASVSQAVVVARLGADGHPRLVAYVVAAGAAAAPGAGELRRHLKAGLPEYMVPSAYVSLDELPLTPSRKVDRRRLPEPEEAGEAGGAAEAGSSPVEDVLIGVWSQLLGVNRVGVNDNFFDLGGHSLIATQVISYINNSFKVDLPLSVIFEAPTVAALAEQVVLSISAGGSSSSAEPITPAPAEGPLPLSFAQQRLWFLSRLEPDNPFYNMSGALRISGDLDVPALEYSLNAVVERHSVLRASFVEVDGGPLQIISPSLYLPLEVTDLSALPAGEREGRLRRLTHEDATRPFDMERCPLLRFRLLRLDEREHVLLLAMHHIISDGWSLGVFMRELSALYESRTRNTPPELPALPIQYADYAAWQRRHLSGAASEAQLSYWERQLSGSPELLALPTDRPRPAVQRHRGASLPFSLPAELTERLRGVSRREGLSLFMTLLAAFDLLLSRLSGQQDICVGTPVAGRPRPETRDLIGFFVNTLVLRSDLSGDPTLGELLARVRETCLGAYAHQEAPFERVVERLRPERSLSHSPLFQVMLALDNTPRGRAGLGGLRVRREAVESGAAKYDLALLLEEGAADAEGGAGEAGEAGRGVGGAFYYDRDLFEAETVGRMAGQFRLLLEALASADPSERLSSLPRLTEVEQELLAAWNETGREYERNVCLHHLFERQAARSPDDVAVAAPDATLTYAELDALAERLARRLRAKGVRPESRVGVLMRRSAGMVAALLGVLKAGGAYVPLDATYPGERLAFMVEDSGAALVLAEEATLGAAREAAGGGGAEVLVVGQEWGDGQGREGMAGVLSGPVQEVTAGNLAYVIYTSGSTGRPKGVGITHEAICNHLLWRQEAYPLGSADRFLHKASLSFDISVWEIFAPLMAGAQLVLAAPGGQQDSAYLVRTMAAERISVVHFGPAMLQTVLEETGLEDCTSLRHVFCGGEQLSVELQTRFFERLNAGLHHQYGPTEATVDVTVWDCEAEEGRQRVPIGRPIANAEVYLLDAGLRPVPVSAPGELCIGGRPLARGYLGRPALTAERFVPDPFSAEPGRRLYRTGDRARFLPGGALEFLGRLDQQVKIRGYRIEPGEVEAALSACECAVQAAVMARPWGQSGEVRLVAYVLGEAGRPLVIDRLRAQLRQRLPEYMLPSVFVVLDELSLTASGKVDRNNLPEPVLGSVETADGEADVAAPTPVEEMLIGIWSQLLGVDGVGVNDNFFELGGHSLLAARLAARVRERFRVELELHKVFEHPTVGGLAAEVEAALRGGAAAVSAGEIVPVERGRGVALSFAQQRLWFLNQLEPNNPAYNMSAAVRMNGTLDVAALEQALSEIVARHEALRTTFRLAEDAPLQIISPPRPVSLPLTDLGGRPEQERENELARLIREEAERPFDLARGPLLRVRLLRLYEEEHVLLFTMHHIVADGWAVGVLVKELGALYESRTTGQPAQLPELPVQYADYAAWQREWLRGGVLERQLSYWRERLGDAPTALELPADHLRPAAQSYRGGHEPFQLSPHLLNRLKLLSRREGVTLFMTLLAALKALLWRYTNQEDVVVGTPVANRGRSEIENLVGFFANTLVLRTDLSGEPTFLQLLGRVREVALGAYSHQDVPFEMLVEELQPERDLGRQPLFQVMLALQNARDAELRLHGLTLNLLRTSSATAKFDLLLSLEETGAGLTGELEYSTDLFEAETARRLLRHFESLLEAAAQRPEQRVSELPLLTEDERRQLLVEWQGGGREGRRLDCLHRVFEARAAAEPDALAVLSGQARLTYGELNSRAERLARYLRSCGVGPEVLVGLCMERGPEMVVGLLAILKAGGAYVPLDPHYPEERLALIIEDARMPLLLTQASLRDRLPAGGARVICLEAGAEAVAARGEEAEEHAAGEVTTENVAYVLYTSGSTGRPKGVALSHGALANLILWQLEHAPMPAGARTLQFASLNFDVSFQEIFSTWCEGGALVLVSEEERRDPVRLLRVIEAEQVGRLYLPYVALRQLAETAEEQGAAPRSLRQVITAGEQLQITPPVVRLFAALDGCRLYNHYGPTEAHVVTTYELGGTPDSWPFLPPIGRPIANAEVYILDPRLRPVPVGVAGELYIGGRPLARGYLGRPSLTAERFVPHPFSAEPGRRLYRTGDRARFLPGGDIEFLGRLDYQVKVRGYRIEPGEVEAALERHAAVRRALVVAQDGADGRPRLVAYVVGEAGAAPAAGELRRHLKAGLPEYMVPSAFVALERMPLTPSGKVDRRRLPAAEAEGAGEAGAVEVGSSHFEELLCDLWRELLGAERVGVNDDFFELGGHSLLAARLIARVRERFRIELELRKLFEHPTVRGLAAEVEAALRGGAAAAAADEIVPVERGQGVALSFAQQRLWFLDQLEPGSAFYSLASATHLEGELDTAALEKSLNEVARRHETLRTSYTTAGGHPVGIIHPHLPTPLPVHDLSGLDADARALEVRRLINEEAQRPFDLGRTPLWRTALLRLGEREHVLLFTMHHIISDGWSIGVLVREVAALYDSFSRGEESPLPELPVQYADYAAWQRRHLSGTASEAQLSYWERQLSGSPELLALPTDRPRPAVQRHRGASLPFSLPAELTERLRGVSRREGLSLFMTLLAAFDLLLSRLSGQQDICVGTPVAGRPRPETRDLIGFFVNTLVLRSDLSGDPTLGELLARVRETCLGAYAHQEAPFERVVERLRPGRSLSHSPLFQVMLALDNTPRGRAGLGGLRVRREAVESGAAKYDLALLLEEGAADAEGEVAEAGEAGRGVGGAFYYDRDLFEAETVGRMAGQFRLLLEALASADPSERLSSLPRLTEVERELLTAWNSTRHPYERDACLHHLFERQATQRPEAVAVAAPDATLTYAELDAMAERLARRLRARGVRPESRVGVLMRRSAGMVAALLGVLKAGGAYVPLDAAYPGERLAFMVKDSGATLVLAEEATREAALDIEAEVVLIEQEWGTSQGEEREAQGRARGLSGPAQEATAGNLAYVIYTSGSTGRPKGVAVSHRNLLNLISWHARVLRLSPCDRASHLAAPSFDAAAWELWMVLTSGAALLLPDEEARRSPERLRDWLLSQAVTVSYMPTPLAEQALGLAWPAAAPLRLLLTGGDRLGRRPPAGLPFEVVDNYGPTECTVIATSGRVGAGEGGCESAPSIGRPVANACVEVLDTRMRRVPVGAAGELYVGGEGVARGYLGRAALTAERFVPDPYSGEAGARLYRTGDVGRWRAGGELEFLGRLDHQVKVRGFRIELGEIEAALASHAGVHASVVLVRGDGPGQKRLVAYVASDREAAALREELRELLKASLPDYMIPSAFVILEALPLTPNGKVDRRALDALEPARVEAHAYVAPRTPTESLIAGLWSEVLGAERVGVNDDFFELGGHSLLATELAWKMREKLGADVPLRALFEHPTVEKLAALFAVSRAETPESSAPAIVPLSRERYRGRLPAQRPTEAPETIQKN